MSLLWPNGLLNLNWYGSIGVAYIYRCTSYLMLQVGMVEGYCISRQWDNYVMTGIPLGCGHDNNAHQRRIGSYGELPYMKCGLVVGVQPFCNLWEIGYIRHI